jgi:cell division protein FtsQ
VRRRLLVALAAIALVALAYQFVVRDRSVTPRLLPARPTAEIGAGPSAVGVSAEGAVLTWLPPPRESSLPRLPLSKPPASGHLTGTVLQQARVLGAAPSTLRPYLKGSRYGESGVDVELSTGVELRFGDDSATARKWRAAAAVLADPSVTALDYVNLSAPGRPGIGGSGHVLPPVP